MRKRSLLIRLRPAIHSRERLNRRVITVEESASLGASEASDPALTTHTSPPAYLFHSKLYQRLSDRKSVRLRLSIPLIL